MKKILVVLFMLFISSLMFAENVISVSPYLDIGTTDITENNEDFMLFSIKIHVSADYKYITKYGVMFGAQASIFPDIVRYGSTTGALDGIVINHTGFGVDFAPIVGYRFGKNHLIGVELLPINVSFSSFKGNASATKIVKNTTVNVDVPLSGDITTFSTQIRANIQFGSGLARNGFIAGLGIPWNIKFSDFKLANSPKMSESYKCSGFYILVGYKISFVM